MRQYLYIMYCGGADTAAAREQGGSASTRYCYTKHQKIKDLQKYNTLVYVLRDMISLSIRWGDAPGGHAGGTRRGDALRPDTAGEAAVGHPTCVPLHCGTRGLA